MKPLWWDPPPLPRPAILTKSDSCPPKSSRLVWQLFHLVFFNSSQVCLISDETESSWMGKLYPRVCGIEHPLLPRRHMEASQRSLGSITADLLHVFKVSYSRALQRPPWACVLRSATVNGPKQEWVSAKWPQVWQRYCYCLSYACRSWVICKHLFHPHNYYEETGGSETLWCDFSRLSKAFKGWCQDFKGSNWTKTCLIPGQVEKVIQSNLPHWAGRVDCACLGGNWSFFLLLYFLKLLDQRGSH